MNPNQNQPLGTNGFSEPRTPGFSQPTPAGQQMVNELNQAAPAQTPAPAPKKSKPNAWMIMTIVFAIIALCGIGFGVYANIDKNDQVSDLNDKLSSAQSRISTLEASANALEENPENYIYIGAWGYKLALPDVSYTYSIEPDYTSLTLQNGDTLLGLVARVPVETENDNETENEATSEATTAGEDDEDETATSEDEIEAELPADLYASFESSNITLIFSDSDYNYFFIAMDDTDADVLETVTNEDSWTKF